MADLHGSDRAPSERGRAPAPYDYYRAANTDKFIEDARLAMQAVLGIDAEAQAWKTISPAGKSVHFVGCGPAYYEWLFAERYKPAQVLGTDVQADSIDQAAADFQGSNLGYKVHNAAESIPGAYDINVERFVLIQVPEEEAQKIVRNMAAATKPGGQAVLIEYVNSYHETEPPCTALTALLEVMMARFAGNGADPDIGLKLGGFLEQAGLKRVAVHDVPYELRGRAFSRAVRIGSSDFGMPADIIANSYARRYREECPREVEELSAWLEEAKKPGSGRRMKYLYKLAIGHKA